MTRPLEFSIVSPALHELKPAPKPTPAPAPKLEEAARVEAAGKSEEKPKEEATIAVVPAPASAPEAAPAPVREEKPAAPPVPEEKSAAGPAPEEKPAPAPVREEKPAAPPVTKASAEAPAVAVPVEAGAIPAFNYEYRSIVSDARGRIVETERRVGRYLSESIASGIVLEMAEVPAGSFLMGAPDLVVKQIETMITGEMPKKQQERLLERLPWEASQRVVKVRGFFMSKFEITQAQWRAVAALPKVKVQLMAEPSEFRGDSLPVERITWEEAVEFCERLSRATGRKYRLPTEAEWEYACRAGSNAPFHFGETLMTEWANFNGRMPYARGPKGEGRTQPVPVGTFGLANTFGLYDMHGNVWEWCQDNWNDSYAGAPDEAHLVRDSGIAYLKAVRGGAWDSLAVECRSTGRNRMTAGMRLNNIGFRVVAEASPSNAK